MRVPLPAPVATVVVTTHNRPDAARRAVRSALAQTIADVEVVVVDDASEPRFALDADDPRVRVVRRDQSGGMCAARNDGLRVARGAWVVFLDDDDELDPAMIERALRAAEDSTLPTPVAVMTGMRFVTPDGDELAQAHPPTLRRGEHYFLAGGDFRAKNGLVMPTEIVRAIGGWDERLVTMEAEDFGIRLNRVASIVGLDDPLYLMTEHPGPRLTDRLPAIAHDMKLTRRKHRDVFRLHPEQSARYMAMIGMYDLRSGRWGSAIAWCLRAVARGPRRARRWRYLGAALAGPYALAGYRRLRPRGVEVSTWTLNRRRARKYAKRLANYPRALWASPVARLTAASLERRVASAIAERPRSVLVCGVYRVTNGARVANVLEGATHEGWDVRLRGLDGVVPDLAAHTISSGPGAKFPLLNELVKGVDLDRYDWLVVTDDDLEFVRGSIERLLATAELAGLDLVQPAHTELSHRGHAISVRRPTAVARRTTFVEIGPVFAVRRPWISKVVPFPAEHTMGWGLELDWFDLERSGARLGIVDSVPIRHLDPVGKGYAQGEEGERLDALLDARGLESFTDVQRTLGTWRPWQVAPPWTSSSRMGREARW